MRMLPVVFEWRPVDVADPKTGVVESAFAMVPLEKFSAIAKRQFEANVEYRAGDWVIGGDVRSTQHHKRYFAALNQAFANFPEGVEKRWPTVEHFRAWALVETHWCNEKEIDCISEKHAMALATFSRSEAPFARIKIVVSPVTKKKTLVFIWVPMSQDYASMDKDTFKKSSDDVLDLAAAFVKVPRGKLLAEAGRNA